MQFSAPPTSSGHEYRASVDPGPAWSAEPAKQAGQAAARARAVGAPRWPLWLLLGAAVLGTLLLLHPGIKGSTTRDFSYSTFVTQVTANKVSTATISSTGLVTGSSITASPTPPRSPPR